jgi:hypothetical protein
MIVMNSVTPKAAAEHELLFKKPAGHSKMKRADNFSALKILLKPIQTLN